MLSLKEEELLIYYKEHFPEALTRWQDEIHEYQKHVKLTLKGGLKIQSVELRYWLALMLTASSQVIKCSTED